METVTYENRGACAEITLNRPEKLNSFTVEMRAALLAALTRAVEDPGVRAVLIKASGKGFCAGQDLAELVSAEADGKPLPFDRLVEEYNTAVRLICGAEKPVICAVNGVAAGAGANLAFACDFVIAADSASFMQAFVHVGLVPDTGGSFFLPRLVGPAIAKKLCMLGEKITAAEALVLGLVYRTAADGELLGEARELADHLASLPTRGLAMMKRALNTSLGNDLYSQLELEKELQLAASRTSDYKEGVSAFLEKRQPKFQGK